MFPVLHDCMDQLSWQKRSDMDSAVWMREVEMILSLLLNKSDWRVWGADSCVLVCSQLPGTALHGLKHIWNMGHDPTTGNKRASCFWRSAEGAILLVLGHQGSNLLAFTWKTSQRGPIPFTPELAACYLLLQHPSTGSWTNQGAGQFLAKESCLLIYTASVHEVHCIIIHSFYQKMPLLPSVQD